MFKALGVRLGILDLRPDGKVALGSVLLYVDLRKKIVDGKKIEAVKFVERMLENRNEKDAGK